MLDGEKVQQVKGMRRLAIDAFIYSVLGVGCIAFAKVVVVVNIWQDVLLVIGGILLGGFCVMVTLIKMKFAKQGGNGQ